MIRQGADRVRDAMRDQRGNAVVLFAVALPVLVREVMTGDAAPARPASLRANELKRPVADAIHKPETGPEHARLLLSLAFATLAAINLGFWRHLRRVYASPRRRAWRRG